MAVDPRLARSSDPRMLPADPRMLATDPRMSVTDPRVSVMDPRTPVTDPRVPLSDPRMAVADPRVVPPDPRIASVSQPPPPPPPVESIQTLEASNDVEETRPDRVSSATPRRDEGGFKLKFCTVCANNQNRYVEILPSWKLSCCMPGSLLSNFAAYVVNMSTY
jgi:hypothetical protein